MVRSLFFVPAVRPDMLAAGDATGATLTELLSAGTLPDPVRRVAVGFDVVEAGWGNAIGTGVPE